MKKYLLGLVCSLAVSGAAHAQTVTITIDAGLLENATGTAAVPVGGLLQLISSSDGTFGAPTATSYVGGDAADTIVASFAMNYSGTTGETVNGFNNIALTAGFAPGDQLLLRFYPSLTFAGKPASPTLGTSYGQVRSNTIEFGPAGGDARETAWVVPAAGSSVDLDYVTVNDPNGGTYSNLSADATNLVLVGVPEPSTYLLFASGFAGFFGLRMWKRRCYGERVAA